MTFKLIKIKNVLNQKNKKQKKNYFWSLFCFLQPVIIYMKIFPIMPGHTRCVNVTKTNKIIIEIQLKIV